ncbi:MAG: Peroxyureidoacrylate/ureidoacrylate amidohydrolase RutB [Gammaproteobacteria bacterium]|nr:Peroxyureidoacrylate/ureidoacrylate amidohydrolase RutB [Gammaproteobacteria bacterium]
MTELSTLRQVAGLGSAPAPLAESALVLIDCQNTYRTGIMKLAGVEEALARAAELLARARSLHVPVVHIMHDAGPGSPYDIRAEIGRIADPVVPAPGEPVVVKNYPNAFVATDLDARLKEAGITDLVLAGFMTHMCVNSTARGAFNLGYRPTVVASATATRDLPSISGRILSAKALHEASLAGMADLFAIVVPDVADLK